MGDWYFGSTLGTKIHERELELLARSGCLTGSS